MRIPNADAPFVGVLEVIPDPDDLRTAAGEGLVVLETVFVGEVAREGGLAARRTVVGLVARALDADVDAVGLRARRVGDAGGDLEGGSPEDGAEDEARPCVDEELPASVPVPTKSDEDPVCKGRCDVDAAAQRCEVEG